MSTASELALADSLINNGKLFLAKANSASLDSDAITYYQAGAATFTRAAVIASNAAQLVVLSNKAASEYAIASFNNAETAGDYLNNTRINTSRATVKTAAESSSSSALLSVNYAKQANSNPKSLIPTVINVSQTLATAATALNLYLKSNACDCTQALINVNSTFISAFNNDLSSGNITGTFPINDFGYGYSSAYALSIVNGGQSNPPCWGDGNPCYTVKALSIKGMAPEHPGTVSIPIPWQTLTIGAGIITTLGFMGSSYLKLGWNKASSFVSRLNESTKAALIIGGGAAATVAAASLIPKSKPNVNIVSPFSLSQKTTLVRNGIYTIVEPTSSILFGSGPTSFASNLSNWLVIDILYYPNQGTHFNTWPTTIPGLSKTPTSTIIYQGRWIGPTGPVPQGITAYQ